MQCIIYKFLSPSYNLLVFIYDSHSLPKCTRCKLFVCTTQCKCSKVCQKTLLMFVFHTMCISLSGEARLGIQDRFVVTTWTDQVGRVTGQDMQALKLFRIVWGGPTHKLVFVFWFPEFLQIIKLTHLLINGQKLPPLEVLNISWRFNSLLCFLNRLKRSPEFLLWLVMSYLMWLRWLPISPVISLI